MRFLAAIVFAVCLAPPVRAETALAPTADGRFAASAQMEGLAPALFVIDTAGACALAPAFSQRNGLAVARATGLNRDGARIDRSVFITPATNIDGHTAALRYATSGNDPSPATAGTIGACLLPGAVMVFDAPHRRISLYGAALPARRLIGPRARLLNAQRITLAHATPVLAVPVRLNNADGLAIVSTGARRSVINRRFAEAAGIDTPQEADASALDLAGWVRPGFGVAIDETGSVIPRSLADRPLMILGLDVIGDYRLVIDYPRDRIGFDPQ